MSQFSKGALVIVMLAFSATHRASGGANFDRGGFETAHDHFRAGYAGPDVIVAAAGALAITTAVAFGGPVSVGRPDPRRL